MRIAVIGGGPGGLFFTVLMKRADPSLDITVFERNPPDATFGFGVVFPERSMRYLRDADPEIHEAFVRTMIHWDALEYRHRGRILRCGGHVFSGLARMDLLRILQTQARRLGAGLRFQHEVRTLADLAGYDLIVAADGLNSLARRELDDRVRPTVHVGRARYIWLGTTQTFTALTFIFEQSADGWFVAHIYPHGTGASTFIVETDEQTWRRAGFDRSPLSETPDGTDALTLDYCDRLFARHLDGRRLLGNNSRWLNFRTVRNRQWHAGNVVLLGDAAHTAHFSVGSGTRMALEDAIALARALREHRAVFDALVAYERERRPAVRRIQRAAEPSRRWFENFRHWTSFAPEQFAFHHVARTRVLSYGTLMVRDAGFVRAAQSAFGGQIPAVAPLRIRGVEFRNRVVTAGSSPAGAGADGAGIVLGAPGAPIPARGAVAAVRLDVRDAVGAPAGHLASRPETLLLLDRVTQSDLDLVAAARSAWPRDRLLAVQIEAWDDPDDDAANAAGVALARAAKARGCDLIAVSMPRRLASRDPERAREAHAHASDLIRNLAGVPTMMLGGDYSVGDVNALILAGRADLCEWPRLAWAGWRPVPEGATG